MSFLTRKPGMTSREARELCQLHELIEESRSKDSVPLALFVHVWRVHAQGVEDQERNARRLVARIRALGYVVGSHGDRETLELKFDVDEALRAEVERWIDQARDLRLSEDAGQPAETVSPHLEEDRLPVEAIKADHELGLSLSSLCRRYKIARARMLALLVALRVERRVEGRPTLEQRRAAVVLESAGELERAHGRVTKAARLLGCDRKTARAFLKRYDQARQRTEA